MPTPNLRRVDGLTFAENDTREIPLQLGFLEKGLALEISYTHTPTADGTALREFPMPVKRLTLVGDGGQVLHDARPDDLIREAIVYDQTPKASLVSGPSTITLAGGAKTGFAVIPLPFLEPFAGVQGELTQLPTWIYQDLRLRVEFGGRDQIVRGGTGAIGSVTVRLTQIGKQADWSRLGDPFAWGTQLSVSGRSFVEYAVDASAETEWTKPLPRTANLRAIILQALDSNGDGSDAIINAITLKLDNNLNQWSRAPYRTIRAENAKTFGVELPPGMAVLEMADDMDISDILEAKRLTALDAIVDRAAVAGTIRIVTKRIEPGRSAQPVAG